MFRALSIDACCRVKGFHVVIGASDTEESEGQLKAHIAGLEALGAHRNQSVILHVRDHEPVRSTNRIIIVDVLRLLQL